MQKNRYFRDSSRCFFRQILVEPPKTRFLCANTLFFRLFLLIRHKKRPLFA